MPCSRLSLTTKSLGAALFLIVVCAGSATAKGGPVSVEISGPGLAEPIVITRESQGSELGRLVHGSGLLPQLSGSDGTAPPSFTRPSGELGARYLVRWSISVLGAPAESDFVIVQYAYVRPGRAPVFFTPEGQPSYQATTVGGWHVATAAVSEILTDIGVPTQGQTPSAKPEAQSPAKTAPIPDGSLPLAVPWLGLLLMVAVGTSKVLRRSRGFRAARRIASG